jgi:serine/threonine-protein kinase
MAVVFLAHDLSLNRKVAIKALLPELLYTEGMDRRFKHEARIAAKLDHPNILVIHSVREANDLLYIVMKLVEGLPLSSIAKVAGPLSIPVVRYIVRYVADALSYAHGEGVIHRDVKPANIMVDRRGNVIVMDFGIAKAADDAHLTRTGLVIGTPAYMSPEQCLAQGVAPASDQYSLGVVAYELLTGKTPFRGSALEMQWAHATAGPPSVRSLRPDCPPELDALVLRMMAKAPADRWPSLHDVSLALADEPATTNAARATLVELVSEVPGRRDHTLPTTPASPVPIGPGPAAAEAATTDPVPTVPNAGPVASPMLTLSQQRIELTTGDSVELIVELDADGGSGDAATIQWQSSDPAVVAVSPDGYVTAVRPGLAEVACTWRGKRAVCVVQVSPAATAVQPAKQAAPAPARLPETVAPEPAVKQPAPRPVVISRETPATSPVTRPQKRWWIGVLAAGLVVAAVVRGVRSGGSPTSVGQGAPTTSGSPTTTSVAPAVQAPSPPTPPAPAVTQATTPTPKPEPELAQKSAAPNAGPPRGSAPAAAGSARGTATATNKPATPPSVPIVPPPRTDSVRLTTNRVDSSGYGASRPAASTPTPAASAATAAPPPATPAARDSSADRIPPASREVAAALFKDFASSINSRTYSRITAAYSQPNDAAAAVVWRDFLVFVRDYTPRAVVRSTNVDASTNPPTITANIDFRWSTDAGFDRVRGGSFTGIGVPVSGGWQLVRVQLAKKFW